MQRRGSQSQERSRPRHDGRREYGFAPLVVPLTAGFAGGVAGGALASSAFGRADRSPRRYESYGRRDEEYSPRRSDVDYQSRFDHFGRGSSPMSPRAYGDGGYSGSGSRSPSRYSSASRSSPGRSSPGRRSPSPLRDGRSSPLRNGFSRASGSRSPSRSSPSRASSSRGMGSISRR